MKYFSLFFIFTGLQLGWVETSWSMARSLPDSSVLLQEKSKLAQDEYRLFLTTKAVEFANLNHSPLPLDPKNPNDLFYAAILFGDLELTQEILQNHPDLIDTTVDTSYGSRITPLMIAALGGSHETFLFLLQSRPALLRTFSENQLTPLHFATRAGSSTIVNTILTLDQSVIHDFTQNQLTPLHTAALSGSLEVAHLILDHAGWFPSFRLLLTSTTPENETAFHAAIRSRSFEMLDYLASLRPDFCKEGAPLEIAIHNNWLDVVDYVLKLNPNAGRAMIQRSHPPTESTLFHAAVYYDRLEILERLIENEQELEQTTWFNRTFLNSSKTILQYNQKGRTPLQLATLMGKIELVKKLAQFEPKLMNQAERVEYLPVLLAIQTNQVDILRFLLNEDSDLGKNISKIEQYLDTSEGVAVSATTTLNIQSSFLHIAVEANQLDAAEFLIAWDPSLLRSQPPGKRSTPKGLAIELGHQEMSDLLTEAEILLAIRDQSELRFLGSLSLFSERQLNLIKTSLIYSRKNRQNPRKVYNEVFVKLHKKLSLDPSTDSELLVNLEKIMHVYRDYLVNSSSLKHLCLRSIRGQLSGTAPSQHPQCAQFAETFQNWAKGHSGDLIPSEIDPVEHDSYSKMMKKFLKDYSRKQ